MGKISYEPEELVPIVAKLAERYTSYESTSVTYETAQALMEAVVYCIREYESNQQIPSVAGETAQLAAGEKISAKEAYVRGSERVRQKAREVLACYNKMMPVFLDYGMQCLGETVKKGIPAFLKWYDPEFKPGHTLLTFDYPILTEHEKYSGVDAVYFYLQCIALEQEWLSNFDEAYVKAALRQYNRSYSTLYENIPEIILPNVMGHVLLKKPLQNVEFTREECEDLTQIFTEKTEGEICELIRKIIYGMQVEMHTVKGEAVTEYLFCCVQDLAVRIKNGVANSPHWYYNVFSNTK